MDAIFSPFPVVTQSASSTGAVGVGVIIAEVVQLPYGVFFTIDAVVSY